MREVDTVARYGGEEFVMILPDTNEAEAVAVAQRIRKAVEQTGLASSVQPAAGPLSISIGLAVFDVHAASKRDLIDFADAALYQAKREGRNRVVSYSELIHKKVS